MSGTYVEVLYARIDLDEHLQNLHMLSTGQRPRVFWKGIRTVTLSPPE